jgi:hypothetical protein
VPIVGATFYNYTIPAVAHADAGQYTCTVIGLCAQAISNPATLRVGLTFDQQPVSVAPSPCETAHFFVLASGKGTLSYQWRRNGAPLVNDGRIFGANTLELTITGVHFEDEGTYTCLVSDDCETLLCNPAQLTLPTPAWVQRSTTGPRQRGVSSDAAYDALRHVAVVYGGYSANSSGTVDQLNDTWEWDGLQWTQRFPAHNPDRRHFQKLVFDTSRNVVLLFGGSGFGNSGDVPPNNEVWAYDGNDWTLLSADSPAGPPWNVEVQHAVFDSARAKMIVITSPPAQNPYQNATWEFDSPTLTWSLATSGTPIGYSGSAFAYDSVRHVTVGQNYIIGQLQSYAATWTFNGASWTNAGVVTPPRDSACMAFDTTRRRTVLYGCCRGGSLGYYVTDTWAFDGAAWQQILPQLLNTNQYDAVIPLALAYDSARHAMIMVGQDYNGSFGDVPMQTWEYRYLDVVMFDRQPEPVAANAGDTVNLAVVAAGWGALSYEWRRNGVPLTDGLTGSGSTISGASSAALQIADVRPADAGSYDCVALNPCGAVTSAPATLTVVSRGDLNCDGGVDFDDINSFVQALVSRSGYEARYPGCRWLNGDIDGDGDVNFDDIGPFVKCLVQNGCPWQTG